MREHPPIYKLDSEQARQPAQVVFNRVRYASSIGAKSVGLMFRRRVHYVLLFELGSTRCIITNLFVFQTIDLVFLNQKKQVLEIRRRFRPFTPYYTPPRGSCYLLEVPTNQAYDLNQGDQLAFTSP